MNKFEELKNSKHLNLKYPPIFLYSADLEYFITIVKAETNIQKNLHI